MSQVCHSERNQKKVNQYNTVTASRQQILLHSNSVRIVRIKQLVKLAVGGASSSKEKAP
jgi:hypothetical protein